MPEILLGLGLPLLELIMWLEACYIRCEQGQPHEETLMKRGPIATKVSCLQMTSPPEDVDEKSEFTFYKTWANRYSEVVVTENEKV